MTSKVYKTAQGKTVDLGTIMLQNEHVRAVGNMNVNARGDRLDENNRVIETKNRQIQRQNDRTTVVAPEATVHTSTVRAKRAQQEADTVEEVAQSKNTFGLDIHPIQEPAPVDTTTPTGGLAAAIARSKIVKQEKEKTLRELAQSTTGVRKI